MRQRPKQWAPKAGPSPPPSGDGGRRGPAATVAAMEGAGAELARAESAAAQKWAGLGKERLVAEATARLGAAQAAALANCRHGFRLKSAEDRLDAARAREAGLAADRGRSGRPARRRRHLRTREFPRLLDRGGLTAGGRRPAVHDVHPVAGPLPPGGDKRWPH